jgi:hypothetical protein
VRVPAGHEHRQLARGAADITKRAVAGEVELFGERLEIARGYARHCVHELLQPLGLAARSANMEAPVC